MPGDGLLARSSVATYAVVSIVYQIRVRGMSNMYSLYEYTYSHTTCSIYPHSFGNNEATRATRCPRRAVRLQKHRQQFKYEDTDTYVYAFPDSSDYTIGIIVDPCQASEIHDSALFFFVVFIIYRLRAERCSCCDIANKACSGVVDVQKKGVGSFCSMDRSRNGRSTGFRLCANKIVSRGTSDKCLWLTVVNGSEVQLTVSTLAQFR